MKISGKLKGELDIKRFYMDGLNISCKCPECGHEFNFDDYISYPKINEEYEFDLYCQDCEYQWTQKVMLRVEFTVL